MKQTGTLILSAAFWWRLQQRLWRRCHAPLMLLGLAGTALAMPAITHDLRTDLRQATQANAPLVLFVTQPNCPYCEQARREFFAPMAREAALQKTGVGKPLLLRELATGTLKLVRRSDGAQASALSIAKSYGVRVFPTVVIVDGAGRLLVEPIEGLRLPDFYQAYIDEAIAKATAALPAEAPPPAAISTSRPTSRPTSSPTPSQ